jgi:hypothetical protein
MVMVGVNPVFGNQLALNCDSIVSIDYYLDKSFTAFSNASWFAIAWSDNSFLYAAVIASKVVVMNDFIKASQSTVPQAIRISILSISPIPSDIKAHRTNNSISLPCDDVIYPLDISVLMNVIVMGYDVN